MVPLSFTIPYNENVTMSVFGQYLSLCYPNDTVSQSLSWETKPTAQVLSQYVAVFDNTFL